MRRPSCRIALTLAALPPGLAAQQWHPGTAVPLVARAAAVRAARDADTLLAGWQAVASGVVRFAVVVGHGANSSERVIRADQLRVEVYGEAPNRSKQQIVAWRDTTFAPTGITYHRDHLGIIANDFGPVIRLGEGDEVRDVIHPLSIAGLSHYEFRLRDTIRVAGAGEAVELVVVEVRPRDPGAPGTVGTLLLDARRAATVRFRFTFTAVAYRDPTVAAITVVLENALLEAERWLPWRQAITIRREGPLLALPIHSLLHADWTIGDYRLGVRHPADRFRGVLVGGLRQPGDGSWGMPFDSVLAGRPPIDAGFETVLGAADLLAPEASLRGLPAVRLLGDRGLSSLLRATRVQGVTPGIGVRIASGDRQHVDLAAAYGTADRRLTGRITLTRRQPHATVRLSVGREVADVDGGGFGSGWVNTLATVISGADRGSWLLRDGFSEIEIRGDGAATAWSMVAVRERIRSVEARFTALDGTRRDNPALGIGTVSRVGGSLGSPNDRGVGGWRVAAELGFGPIEWGRLELMVRGPLGPVRWRVDAGAATGQLPAYRSFVAGGRASLVGVPHRSIGGRRLLRAELAMPIRVGVPAPGAGRWARGLFASGLVPYLAVAVAGGDIPLAPWRAAGRVEPVLGLRLDLWGPLLRLEAGWAPRQRALGLTVDAHPDWWPLL